MKRTADEWQQDLMNAGVVCGKVTGSRTSSGIRRCSRAIWPSTSPTFGRTATVAGDPLGFAPLRTWRAPSQAGADTAMVLRDVWARAHDDIARLHDARRRSTPGGVKRRSPAATIGRRRLAKLDRARQMQPPLEGMSILELNGDEPSKCFAAQLLADLGADVIRVDRPAGQIIEPYPDESREASFRAGLNRGKRSITADLKTDEGRALFTDWSAERTWCSTTTGRES